MLVIVTISAHKGISNSISRTINFTDRKMPPCQTNKSVGIYKTVPKRPVSLTVVVIVLGIQNDFTRIKTVEGNKVSDILIPKHEQELND